MRKTFTVEVECEVVHETEDGYKINDGLKTCWVSKARCTWDADKKVMTMPEQYAIEKELI